MRELMALEFLRYYRAIQYSEGKRKVWKFEENGNFKINYSEYGILHRLETYDNVIVFRQN